MKRDILLVVLIICLSLISGTLLSISIQKDKIVQEQTRIITLQTETIFNYQTTIELQDQLIKDHEDMNDVFYEILNLHGLLQEVE